MKELEPSLSVRDMEIKDIPLLVAYWLHSTPDHLVGMGVDLQKLPLEEDISKSLKEQLLLPIRDRQSYALIWLEHGRPIGHCNVNQIVYGREAYMHLHLWKSATRKKGLGAILVKKSISVFFDSLELDTLYCEPYALNPAPNKTLAKIGFNFVKEHTTIPGTLNFEQKVNLWAFEKAALGKIKL